MRRMSLTSRWPLWLPGILLAVGVGVWLHRWLQEEPVERSPTFSNMVSAEAISADGAPRRNAPDAVEAPIPPVGESIPDLAASELPPDGYMLRILDDEGRPVRQGRIVVRRRVGATLINAANDQDALVAGGAIELPLTDGALQFRADRYSTYEVEIDVPSYAVRRYRLRDPGRRVIRLTRPAAIVGHVFGPDARPVAGVQVDLWHGGSLSETTVTDANGFYSFERVTPELATVRLRPRGFARPRVEHVRVAAGTRSVRDFDLRAGGRLDVVVRGPGGKVRPRVAVAVVEARSGEVAAFDLTGNDGACRFSCLRPGVEYMVRASDKEASARSFFRAPDRIDTAQVRTEVLMLVNTWTLSGIVVTESGIPVDGARIMFESRPLGRVSSTAHTTEAVTGADGRFRVRGLIADVVYSAMVFHPQFGVVSQGGIEQGSPPLSLVLPEPGVFEGLAVAEDGSPLRDAIVWVTLTGVPSGTLGRNFVLRSDQSGNFRVPNLPMGAPLSLEIQDQRGISRLRRTKLTVSEVKPPSYFALPEGEPPAPGATVGNLSPIRKQKN